MDYMEIEKIFDFLKNFNNLLWSMEKKETIIELLTIQVTEALTILKELRNKFKMQELEKKKRLEESQRKINNPLSQEDTITLQANTENNNQLNQIETDRISAPVVIFETYEAFKKGTWSIVALYIDCKCALKMWPRSTHTIAQDRILSECINIEIFGTKEQIKESILKRIDTVMTKHFEKEEEEEEKRLINNGVVDQSNSQGYLNQYWVIFCEVYRELCKFMRRFFKYLVAKKHISLPVALFLTVILVKK